MSTKLSLLLISCAVAAFAVVVLAQSPDENLQDEDDRVFPKGDDKQGRIVFEVKNCHRCHTIEGEMFPEIDLPAIDHISLCGENNGQWSRDDFAHHIMSPQHLISPDHQKAMLIIGDKLGAVNSPMPTFNDLLTVRDLINVASYLESKTK
ncbi:MAG: hypothetical protein P1V20_22825 [Verrucomicrobiales bacterium]|nr:hypothetical protein [Verrucomicrobiales bacterium]